MGLEGGWGVLGLSHTFSSRFSKPLSGFGSGIKRNRLAWGGGEVEVDKNHPVTPSQKVMGLFSGSPIQGQTHRDLMVLSDSWLRRGLLAWGWGSREGDHLTSCPSGRVTLNLENCYASPGP